MYILDCENDNTMLESLENIIGIDRLDIFQTFDKINIDVFDSMSLFDIYKAVTNNRFMVKHKGTCWFHCSRKFQNENYEKGLLPIHDILDHLWNNMYLLAKQWVSSEDWLKFRYTIEDSNNYHSDAVMYRDKLEINETNQFGPYGFLFYELGCFRKKNSSKLHYLTDGSEIIYHLCNFFSSRYNKDLLSEYKRHTKPCIVKFETNPSCTEEVSEALRALYFSYKNLELDIYDAPLYPGRGKLIQPDKILKIIYV